MSLRPQEIAITTIVAFLSWSFVLRWIPALYFLGYGIITGSLLASLAIGASLFLSARPLWSSHASQRKLEAPAFVKPTLWAKDTQWLGDGARYSRKVVLASASLAVAESFDELLDLLLRDFVASWYGNISSSLKFVNELDNAIRKIIIKISSRLEGLETVEIAVLRFAPIVTTHLRDFYEAERIVRGKDLKRQITESEELDLAIAAKYREGNLHPAVSMAFSDTTRMQAEYLQKIVARILPELVSEDITHSKAITVLIRELVSHAALSPLLQQLSDPDTWNRILEAFGKTMLQDRKTVQKLRAALDTHASPAPRSPKTRSFPKLSPRDDNRTFERFIRAIRQIDNISEARRLRNEISSQLKRESIFEGHDHSYLRRLETGKQILDQHIGKLSAIKGSARKQPVKVDSNAQTASKLANASINNILRDASGLSYFMEYMDRLHLMSLVQFWLVVDGFRNPLEEDTCDELGIVDMPKRWGNSDRLDIAQISEAYLGRPELRLPFAVREVVQDFLESGRHATVAQYCKARSAILRAQTLVKEQLEDNHLPNFRKSDLFYQLLTSEDALLEIVPGTEAQQSQYSTPLQVPDAQVRSHPSSPPLSRNASGILDSKSTAKSSLSSDLSATLLVNRERPLQARSTHDMTMSRSSFNDEVESGGLEQSRISFDAGSSNGEQSVENEKHMVEAMEAALSTIMTHDRRDEEVPEQLFDDLECTENDSSNEIALDTGMSVVEQPELALLNKRQKPNLASLGLVDTSSRIGFFRDDDLFGQERFLEDEHAESGEGSQGQELEEEIHEAAPGDLGLAEAISALTIDIDTLVGQESIVDTLARKAELTNNVPELRILGKSKSSLQREMRRKELQRQQYIVQERDNSLFGRAFIDMKSIVVGRDGDGQEFALYVVEVGRQGGDHMPAASWAVARRYSEFHRLHQCLRQIYPAVRNLDFPRRHLVMKLQNEFLHRRRVSLERYLRELLRLPTVCQSRDLRAFLSERRILSKDDMKGVEEGTDIVSRICGSVAHGMGEVFETIRILDQLSIAGQNLTSAATSQHYSPTQPSDATRGAQMHTDVQAARTELEAFDNQTWEPIVKPMCDLFLELFELNRSENWLRGRAVVVVLHQLLGGTIERKVRETVKSLVSENSLLNYIALVKGSIWHGGVQQREWERRTEAEKRASRREASVVLATLVPEVAGSVVGRANAQAAGRRLFATLNNPRLNSHLIFRLLDEVIAVLYPSNR
ncbi:MAG: hypothetical protein LQ340_007362 [Diploschistes diacapsis]|nr:MAG: hypothetical protein LQ340_007362 [Diploschistes diacapsis]